MSKEPKFFLCEHCGNLMTLLEESGVPVVCCGDEMTELVAGTSDGSYEKHVPDVKVD
jgi:superoxide reductase